MDIAANTDPLPASASTPAPASASPARNGPFERRPVMSAAVDIASPDAIVAHLIDCAEKRSGCSVVGISAPYAMAMRDDPALREAFMSADLLVPDGKGFAWGARMLGVPCGERIAVPDLCERLFEEGARRGWKVFIYGATADVNSRACENVRQRFPGLAGVDGQNGYDQSAADEDQLIARFKADGYHLVIVARPSPDKEKFLARCCPAAGVVGIAAGGYADILAGQTRRAPAFVQAIGMEWLFRVVQEPGRLWKRVGLANVRFAGAVLWQSVRQRPARPWWGSATIHAALITLAVVASYVGFMNAPYHFDDPEYILRNPTIRSWEGLSEITVLAHRKLWWLSNAASYKLSEVFGNHQFDKPDVRIFRAWNIACHLIAAFALYGLLRRCAKASAPADDPATGSPRQMIPFAAAAIFAAHPLCTESVTYISGRDNGQGGMFYLLGLYFAALMFDRMGLGATPLPTADTLRWPRWFWPGVAMIVMGAGAVLTKESHLTFPAAVALVYLTFYRSKRALTVSVGLLVGLTIGMGVLAIGAAGRKQGYLLPALQVLLLLAAAGALLGSRPPAPGSRKSWLRGRVNVGWAFLVLVIGAGLAAVAAFPYAYERTFGALAGEQGGDPIRSLCTQAYAVPWMLLRAIAPFELNIDHDFPSISDGWDPRVVKGGLILAALLIFSIVGLFKRWFAAFGILLAIVSIAPSNSIIERGDVVSERNFYLAAAGGACVIAWLAALLASGVGRMASEGGAASQSREASLWASLLGICVAAPFASFTIQRNQEWNDSYKLWASAKELSPTKLRVLYNFGVTSFARKRYDDADNAFTSIIRIGEEKAEKGLFRPDEAVEVKVFHLAYHLLAQLYQRRALPEILAGDQSRLAPVHSIYKDGLLRSGYDPDIALTYSMFLMELNRASDSIPVLETSLKLHAWADQLYHPLARAMLETGSFDAAATWYEKTLTVKERHTVGVSWDLSPVERAELHAYLALARLRMGQKDEARKHFNQAMMLEPAVLTGMLTTSHATRNVNLKPPQSKGATDILAMALGETRRAVLSALIASLAEVEPNLPRQHVAYAIGLRNILKDELARRDELRKKRAAYGFTDDPDKDE